MVSSKHHGLAGIVCRCGWVMAQFLWKQKYWSKIPLELVQMQPSCGSLPMDNSWHQERPRGGGMRHPACWVSRWLLSKERVCNKMGNQVMLEREYSGWHQDCQETGKSMLRLTRPQKSENVRGSLSLGNLRAFHNRSHFWASGTLWGAGRPCHTKKVHWRQVLEAQPVPWQEPGHSVSTPYPPSSPFSVSSEKMQLVLSEPLSPHL